MSKIQSIIFKKDDYSTLEARSWLAAHDKKPIKDVDITKNYYRYRMREPNANKSYRILDIGHGIKFVLEVPKR